MNVQTELLAGVVKGTRTQSPGLSPARLSALMRDAIKTNGLDLTDMTVLTEAASGAYGVTAVIAALANARQVHALARASAYGSVAEVSEWTMELAKAAGVADRISILETLTPDLLKAVDLVTNAGHLRPINREIIDHLPSRAVIALMFEAWEFRATDIDVEACRRRHIPIVGVNEQHPSIDVFSYLGPLCVRLLHDAGFAVYRNRIALLCDNGFAKPMVRGLVGCGANVSHFSTVEALPSDLWDAIVVALKPGAEPRVGEREAGHIASAAAGGATVAQFWGDVDREALARHDLRAWPPSAPRAGHMAILLSALGPDAIVRLQAGGLRAAEWVFRGNAATRESVAQLVEVEN
jgi:hypothetical protein